MYIYIYIYKTQELSQTLVSIICVFRFFESVKFESLSVKVFDRERIERLVLWGREEGRFIRGRSEKKVQGVVGIKK